MLSRPSQYAMHRVPLLNQGVPGSFHSPLCCKAGQLRRHGRPLFTPSFWRALGATCTPIQTILCVTFKMQFVCAVDLDLASPPLPPPPSPPLPRFHLYPSQTGPSSDLSLRFGLGGAGLRRPEFIQQSHADMDSHLLDFYGSLSIPWVMKRFHPLRHAHMRSDKLKSGNFDTIYRTLNWGHFSHV